MAVDSTQLHQVYEELRNCTFYSSIKEIKIASILVELDAANISEADQERVLREFVACVQNALPQSSSTGASFQLNQRVLTVQEDGSLQAETCTQIPGIISAKLAKARTKDTDSGCQLLVTVTDPQPDEVYRLHFLNDVQTARVTAPDQGSASTAGQSQEVLVDVPGGRPAVVAVERLRGDWTSGIVAVDDFQEPVRSTITMHISNAAQAEPFSTNNHQTILCQSSIIVLMPVHQFIVETQVRPLCCMYLTAFLLSDTVSPLMTATILPTYVWVLPEGLKHIASCWKTQLLLK